MRDSTPELDALLASKQALIASLFTISLANDDVLTLTSAPDFNVTWLGNTYNRDYVIEHGDITSAVGVAVDEIDVTLYVRPDDRIYGMPVPKFVHNKGFDGARILIERAFMSEPGIPVGVVHLFEGAISEPEPSRMVITMKASSDLITLNQMVPRHTITPGCSNVLFDDLCSLDRLDWTHAGTALAGSTRNGIVSDLVQADGYFTQGTVRCLTGNNAGAKRTVKRHVSGQLVPAYPFYYPFTVGDEIEAVAGCNRLRVTCRDKFNNEANIRIFEKVPTPVTSA